MPLDILAFLRHTTLQHHHTAFRTYTTCRRRAFTLRYRPALRSVCSVAGSRRSFSRRLALAPHPTRPPPYTPRLPTHHPTPLPCCLPRARILPTPHPHLPLLPRLPLRHLFPADATHTPPTLPTTTTPHLPRCHAHATHAPRATLYALPRRYLHAAYAAPPHPTRTHATTLHTHLPPYRIYPVPATYPHPILPLPARAFIGLPPRPPPPPPRAYGAYHPRLDNTTPTHRTFGCYGPLRRWTTGRTADHTSLWFEPVPRGCAHWLRTGLVLVPVYHYRRFLPMDCHPAPPPPPFCGMGSGHNHAE